MGLWGVDRAPDSGESSSLLNGILIYTVPQYRVAAAARSSRLNCNRPAGRQDRLPGARDCVMAGVRRAATGGIE